MPRLVALDFDGVIADSAPEAFVVALRAWRELRPEGALQAEPALLADAAPAPERVRAQPLYARFLEHMPLGNRAEDYAVVLRAIEAGEPLPDQAAYDRFKAKLDGGWLRGFHRSFYRERARLAAADEAAWFRLMRPYPGIAELLRRRAGDALLAIATAKDRRSVEALLGAYGIADLFPEDRILDKETGVSKRSHLEQLAERFAVPFPEMLFVDDKVNHLDSVSPLGVACGLAAWGYNGEREIDLALARGHRVIRLAAAERAIFGP